jgi:hypothetical protein
MTPTSPLNVTFMFHRGPLSPQIPANGNSTFVFMLTWHFPNRFVNWSQQVCCKLFYSKLPTNVSPACLV